MLGGVASLTRSLQSLSLGGIASLHTSCHRLKRPGIIFKYRPSFKWAEEQAGLVGIPYTHDAMPQVRTGGRGPFGRTWLKHVSGGLKLPTFWVDPIREGVSVRSSNSQEAQSQSQQQQQEEEEQPLIEEILLVHKNFWRRHLIALVASGTRKRWIVAGAEMRVGDLTTSHPRGRIPDVPVANPKPGDAYPIGALPEGTIVSCVEQRPGQGARLAVEGGSSATYVRSLPDGKALVVTPSKQEMIISRHCMVMVGQVSGQARAKFKNFSEKSHHGIKQRSGHFQKKGDRFGRRIKTYTARFDCTAPYPVNFDVRTYMYTWPGECRWRKPLPRFVASYADCPRFRWNQAYVRQRLEAAA